MSRWCVVLVGEQVCWCDQRSSVDLGGGGIINWVVVLDVGSVSVRCGNDEFNFVVVCDCEFARRWVAGFVVVVAFDWWTVVES